ncbi:MAG: outer membrane protein assembly factor BamD [Candidatus Eisenbacteria bacterium]
MHRGVLILYLLCGLALFRCGGGELLPEGDPAEQVAAATGYLEDGKSQKALEAFQIIARTYPGTEWEEAARFGIARSQRKMKDYPTALQLYETFIRRFPRSEYVDDAAFESALCYSDQRKKPQLDPEMNRKALAGFEDFLARYPESDLAPRAREEVAEARDHFAEKALMNGITYTKLRRPGAARYYFQIILNSYPESRHVPEALYRIGETHRKQKHREETVAALAELRSRFPDSSWTAKLAARLGDDGIARAGEGGD